MILFTIYIFVGLVFAHTEVEFEREKARQKNLRCHGYGKYKSKYHDREIEATIGLILVWPLLIPKHIFGVNKWD